MKHYVYTLSDPRDDQVFYVGKGTGRRYRTHAFRAINGNHPNSRLQKRIREIVGSGLVVTEAKIFESDSHVECCAVETAKISELGIHTLCNQFLSDERERIGVSRYWLGKKHSPEHVAKQAATKTGRKDSDETRASKSAAHKGKGQPWLRTEESIKKMSDSKRGKKHKKPRSLETIAKIAAAHIGLKASEEARANMSLAKKGKPLSEKAKAYHDSKRGVSLSPEHRKKISASMLAFRAKETLAPMVMALILLLAFSGTAKAYLLVEDIPHLTQSIQAQAANFAKEVQSIENQLSMITNQVTQISQETTYLTRLGNPQTYVNMLGLGSFSTSVGQLQGGLGQTIQQYRGLANGASALGYTGNGLYQNWNGTLDRFGNPVTYNTQDFAKFSTVQNMTEDLSKQQTNFNTQNTSLLGQLLSTLQKLNSETTQIGSEKLVGQVHGINGQLIVNQANAQLAGQRLQAQVLANQNDAARTSLAQNQQLLQERQADIQNEARQFGNFIGGPSAPSGGVLP